ncbi:MAG: negative regulator of flagellin synthesis FlgM [Planctomycetota bacterium]|jgi:negative regulator of flagellin synthesis FlgM
MTDAINANSRLRGNIPTPDNKANSTSKADSGATGSQSDSASTGGSGIVELSGSALILQISEQIKNVPEVNAEKVDAIKQALSDGQYQPDAEVIARKFSEIESLLP